MEIPARQPCFLLAKVITTDFCRQSGWRANGYTPEMHDGTPYPTLLVHAMFDKNIITPGPTNLLSIYCNYLLVIKHGAAWFAGKLPI